MTGRLASRLRTGVAHPVVGLALRVYLGGVFVYASMYKINYPVEEPLGWDTLLRDLAWLAMAGRVYAGPSAWELEGRLFGSLGEV